MIEFDEKQLILPWIILPPDEGASSLSLLVSSPDGTMLEFEISPLAAQQLGTVLAQPGLWTSFFTSLLASMEHIEEINAE